MNELSDISKLIQDTSEKTGISPEELIKDFIAILLEELQKEIDHEVLRAALGDSLNSNSEIASHLKTISKQRKDNE